MVNKTGRGQATMLTEVNYCEMIKELVDGPERACRINPFYEDRAEYQVKVCSDNDKNTVVPYQQKKEKDILANVKMTYQFPKLTNQIRILIAESDRDILLLFKEYLELIGAESVTTDHGDKALHIFQEDEKEGKKYDVVLLDTHLKGILGLDVAKMIHTYSPNQRIVLLTTTIKEELPQEALSSIAIEDRDILVMPFKLSQLRTILN